MEAVRHPAHAVRGLERLPLGLVGVDHQDPPVAQHAGEPRFCAEVLLEARMIVEMFVRQVGEYARRERQAVHASLIQGVGGHFHREASHAGVAQPGQGLLKAHRARRREALFIQRDAPAVERPQRADRPGVLRGVEERAHQRHRRPLAVRAGDTDDLEVAGGNLP